MSNKPVADRETFIQAMKARDQFCLVEWSEGKNRFVSWNTQRHWETWQAALSSQQPIAETDDDPPCTDCDDTGITKQTERPCSCEAGDAFRANRNAPQAEGTDDV